MGVPTGLECKAYYNSAATQASPTWVEIDIIINLDVSMSWEKPASECRRSGGIKQFGIGSREDEVTFNVCHDNSDTTWEFLRAKAVARGAIHLQILDGVNVTSGTEGWTGTYYIYQMDESQQLSESVEESFTIAPSNNPIDPTIAESAIAPIRMSVA